MGWLRIKSLLHNSGSRAVSGASCSETSADAVPAAGSRPCSVCAANEALQASEAIKVFEAFGGVRRFHEALYDVGVYRNRSSLYKWTHPKADGGTDGRVPRRMWRHIIKAARAKSISVKGFIS